MKITLDDVTLFLALWGAILSTILGFRELRKDRRYLKLILEYVHWMETRRLVIINVGHRPITLEQVSLEITVKKLGPYSPMPKYIFWSDAEDYKPPELPLTLEDGKMAIFYVSDVVNNELLDSNKYLKVKVYDAEGNLYTKYTEGEYDPKYGYRSEKYKPPGRIRTFFIDLRWRISEWITKRRRKNK